MAGLRLAAPAFFALALAGCASTDDGGGEETGDGGAANAAAGGVIIIGTTGKITTIDPAGSYDNGSFAVMNQVYPFLLNTPYGSPDVEPDIAASAEFVSPTEYQVVLKEGLTFANGNELTASDVKFTFDRQLAINDVTGPASLLYTLDSVDIADDLTVVFNLKSGNDQVFPQILSSPAGPIVDEEVFAADALTPDQEIVDGQAFAGQYTISAYDFNNLVEYTAFDGYQGLLGPAETGTVIVNYYADASNLKLEVQEGQNDVAHRSLSATDIEDLQGAEGVTVHEGPGGEIRYIVWNFNTQPTGATTAGADAARAGGRSDQWCLPCRQGRSFAPWPGASLSL